MQECPECGVRQYAQMSYVTPIECVACGFRLGPTKSPPARRWPALSSRYMSVSVPDEERPTGGSRG
jgi:hypothetical protein